MRKVTEKTVEAFINGNQKVISNTRTDDGLLETLKKLDCLNWGCHEESV